MATTTNKTTTIKHVYGNVLKLAIPLTLRTITLENGEAVATDTDYIPSSGNPVIVEFSKGPLKYEVKATMRDGNVAVVEDKGTIPVGCYAITVCCTDDNGDPRRFKQKCVLHVYDLTAEAGIEAGIEFEGTEWYLDAAIFLAVKGEDGADGADGNGIAYITTNETSVSGAYNTITFHLTDGTSVDFRVRNGASTEQILPEGVVTDTNYVHTDNNYTDEDKANVQKIMPVYNNAFGRVDYDTETKHINFYAIDDMLMETLLGFIDATPFVLDGMLSRVEKLDDNLVFIFNTDSGKAPIYIPISSIFNAASYYTKSQINVLLSNSYYTKSDVDLLLYAKANNSDVYNKVTTDRLLEDKADILADGKMPVSQAAPVVLDYIYTPPPAPAIPVLPSNPTAGVVIYFNNENKIRRYYFETAGQSGGIQSLTYVEETPSRYVVYYNKDDEKFYRYNGTTLVEIETGGGTVTAVKMNNGTPIEPDSNGVVDLGTVITSHQDISGKANTSDLADVATSGSYNDLDDKPTITSAISVNNSSHIPVNGIITLDSYYTQSEVDDKFTNYSDNFADVAFSGNYNDLGNTPSIPTKTSDLTNDLGFLTSHQSLASVFGDVAYDSQTKRINFYGNGDTNHTTVLAYVDATNFIKDGMVSNVEIKNVTIDNVSTPCLVVSFNTDAGKDDINIPLSGIFNPSNYYTKTDVDTALGNKVDKVSGKGLSTNDYTTTEKNKLAGIAAGAEVNVQSDWNQTTTTADDYIKNKPNVVTGISVNDSSHIPVNGVVTLDDYYTESEVDSAFENFANNLADVATSGDYDDLGNKPTIPTVDSTPTQNSTNAVQSGGVYTALAGKLGTGDVSVETPSTADGTFTVNVGSNSYTVNLNHTHQSMAKLVVCEESDLPSTLDHATIYALVDDEETPTEIQSLWIAGIEFVGGGGVSGQPRVTSPANGSTIDIGYNDGTGVSDTITVKGKDLTSGLTVAISGTGFSLTYGQSTGQSSISIAQADALLGAQVTIVNSGSGRATDGVLVISHGNDVLSTVSVETSLLPSGYTQLDYIENIVKGLDTGIKATNSTTVDSSASGSSWEVDIQCNSVPSSNQFVVCTDEDTGHWFYALSSGSYSIGGGNTISASMTSRNTITVAFTGGSISASCGGSTASRAYTVKNNKNVCLFENINYTMSQYGGGVFTVGRIYGAKCTSGGSFNGVPTKRNSDNHFGLYDVENSVFYDLSSNS